MIDVRMQRQAERPANARWRRIAIGLAIVAALLGSAWFERDAILWQIGAWWIVSDELKQADAVVVLGGDLDVRPFAAAALYERGFAAKVLVSNVPKGRAERLGLIRSHTELNCDILLKLGVPETAIVTFGEHNTSTQEEAEAARAWAVQSHAKRLIVPTEIFSARRTRWIFERELGPIGVQVIVHAYPPFGYTLADWWRNRVGVVDFNNEILKYLYYRVHF